MFLFVSVASKGSNTKAQDMAKLEPMMRLVLFCIDRVRKFKLGKDVSELSIILSEKLSLHVTGFFPQKHFLLEKHIPHGGSCKLPQSLPIILFSRKPTKNVYNSYI